MVDLTSITPRAGVCPEKGDRVRKLLKLILGRHLAGLISTWTLSGKFNLPLTSMPFKVLPGI